ncbi:MAG: alpha/beta hydrolase [Ktedonobacteraceae bacterium]|nr:alpha/beta hydrolase [Ktedonobacteraceae bacterium]
MPFLETARTHLYYDIFGPDITGPDLTSPPGEREAQASNTPTHSLQTVLLIHGFAGTSESDFAGQLPALRARYRVLAPHLHGYGRSTQRTRYTPSYYREDVADLLALLDALSIEQALVLGFSDGGIVGLLLAALHPDRVQALAVLGAQPTIDERDVAAIRHWLLEKPLSQEWQAQLAELHGEPYWRMLPGMYVSAQEALVAAGGVLISDEELASIHCPTLIMHGDRDRIVPADYSRVIHAHIPNSRLLLFDAGHAAHLRCEQEFTQVVMSFFNSV